MFYGSSKSSSDKRTYVILALTGALTYFLMRNFLHSRSVDALRPTRNALRRGNASDGTCEFDDYVPLEMERFDMLSKLRRENVVLPCLPRSINRNSTKPSVDFDFQLSYDVTVDVGQLATNGNRRSGCAVVHIRETMPATEQVLRGEGDPHLTVRSGGSEFYLLVTGNEGRRYTCLVRDHFDGNYTGYCPLYGGCLNLTVTLQHQRFTGYCISNPRMLKRVVWRGRLCPSDFPTRRPLNVAPSDHDSAAYVGWWTDPDSNSTRPEETWKGRAGIWLSRQEEEDLIACLQTRINTLTVIGDSHLTYVRAYFLSLIGKLTPKVGRRSREAWIKLGKKFRQVDKTWYYPVSFTDGLLSAIDEHLAYLATTNKACPNATCALHKNDVIIFDGGAWELFEGGAEFYATKVSNLALFIDRVRRNALTREATVAFFTIPPASGKRDWVMHHNSNAQVAVCNALSLRELRRQAAASPLDYERVHVVNYYAMVLAHYEKGVDDHHVLGKDSSGFIHGEMGKRVTAEGFRQICQLLS